MGGTALRDAVRGHTQVATLLSKRGGELLDEVAAPASCAKLRAPGASTTPAPRPRTSTPQTSAFCLHLAASEGNLRIVEFLLDFGADITSATRGTALRDAVRRARERV